jgi:SP family general alpha glucoside:H+ symporter-like MFS transporter
MADNQDKVSPAPADAPPSKTPAVDESAALDSSDPSKTHRNIIEHARAAAHKERKMTLRQGIKLYPKAIFWSILISTCIAMEGYDISLVNNFCMPPLPLFT